MSTVFRQVAHEDQLSLVEHLDELRSRLVISLVAFIACFAVALWQNDNVLEIVNRPFNEATKDQNRQGTLAKTATYAQNQAAFAAAVAQFTAAVQADDNVSRATRSAAEDVERLAERVQASVPSAERQPVTLGVAEPFTATFKVAAYAALLLALPIILWQMYAFVLPAFSPTERRVALPFLMMVPFLFIAGATFAYFVVVPSAITVLQNFNADNFDILVQARDLYKFTILTCMAVGGLFQVPIGVLLLTRMKIVTVPQLRQNRRYAILVIAVLAMLLPGTDPITMLLSMAPLIVLYEASIIIAALLERREANKPDKEYEGPSWWDDDDEDD